MIDSPNGTEELMDDLSDEVLHTELTDEAYEELAVSEGAVVIGLAFWDSSLADETDEEPPAAESRVVVDLDLYLDDNTLLELYGASLFSPGSPDPLVGLAAIEGIAAVTGLRAALKWPNDILWQGRKLGGMLAELRLHGEQIDYVVLGLGLNVNLTFGPGSPAPAELWTTATSLQMAVGRPISRLALLAAIVGRCEVWYDRLLRGEPVHAAWAAQLDTLGRPVTIREADRDLHGVAIAVTPEGGLIVRTDDGREEIVWAGDVHTLRVS